MIHVVTVHWKDDRWVDIQLKYLNKFIKSSFRVYAFLNFLPEDHCSKFYYASTDNIQDHATKLNLLADIVCDGDANDNDWLIFLDGDAFPIADLVDYIDNLLKKFPLAAVKRIENVGDQQPHPLFAFTTVGFWKQIKGDWRKGYKWNNSKRMVTDVGGNLLEILEKNKIDWFSILRSNKTNLHFLNFGIYGGVVYHHGASFRPNISRGDKVFNAFKPNLLLRILGRFRITKKVTHFYEKKHNKKISQLNKMQSDEIFKLILKDEEFFRMLI